MKKTAKYLAATVVASSLFMSGCASTTQIQSASAIVDQLQIGDSKESIVNRLGQPHAVEFYKNLNEEAWTYYRFSSINDNLVIGFKDGNKVTSISQIPFARSFGTSFD